jgi:hypothetical protein
MSWGSPAQDIDPVAYLFETCSGATRPQDDSAPRQDFYDGVIKAMAGRSAELGKGNAKTTDTLRGVRLGKFQQFICKPVPLWEESPRERRRMNMLVNRRQSERRMCRRFAKIQFGTGSLPRDCTITDLSEGGVKVVAEYADIPPEFTIILSTSRPRQCRLAWRIGHEFGAQFID